ncbi:TPA: head-tail connector protein [Escherichia coli]|uniref:head-tail connector protein n=1 Tax=Escherichia coli TaxID=562 RepID=UPI000BE47EEE|nr:head-tail connector protein [Escherichia coli]EFC1954649.1 phage gp6-like head-tail connector protein [Escherichia coli]EFJ3221784.1 phage gp6-like head-tail connector protein [Escherichia coli]HBN7449458.1 phage gp6-like head-tail connector protein [Escherichia coli]
MSELITMEEAKQHCRIDGEDDDSILQLYIDAALEVCQKHIGKSFVNGLEFTPAIHAGCLMYIGHLYENREATSATLLTKVPLAIDSLWSVYREPGIY